MERTYTKIEWEVDSVIDHLEDGKLVSLSGFAYCDEGGGHFDFQATAIQTPDGELTEIEIDKTEFVPNEKEPEDGE